MTSISTRGEAAASTRLPWGGLLALATAGFITVLTEALPAGLLPQMGAGLAVSEALVGQFVTFYAVGSLLAAIPLTAATQRLRRRPLLLTAIGGFALVNGVTAVSDDYGVTLIARFFAGLFAGLLWALLAGYAARMVAPEQRGRAITVAMLGAPLALSIGIPAGTLLGTLVGWRVSFAVMSLLSLALVAWAGWKLPDFPGQPAGRRLPLAAVWTIPGVKAVLLATLTFVLAHNVLYTYIAPFLARAELAGEVDRLLFLFGLASILGIWITGTWIDRRLRGLALAGVGLCLLAIALLGLWGRDQAVICAGMAVWGLAFGGAGALFQTASAKAAGEAADLAQSMIVTAWNLAIAGGGLLGAFLLDRAGAMALPWACLLLLLLSLWTVAAARGAGFPVARR